MRTLPVSGFYNRETLCYALLLVLPDSTTIGVLGGGVPFSYDGTNYTVTAGVTVSNIEQTATSAPGNLTIKSLLNDALNQITTSGLVNFAYENSDVYIQEFDWTDPSIGPVVWARYILGKVTLGDSGYESELRETQALLKNMVGLQLASTCWKAGNFGQPPCDPTGALATARTFTLTVCAVVNKIGSFFIDVVDTHDPPYFRNGKGLWSTGSNSGQTFGVESHYNPSIAAWSSTYPYGVGGYSTSGGATYISLATGNTNNSPSSSPLWWQAVPGNPTQVSRLRMSIPNGQTVAPGDTMALRFGCDGQLATCQGVANADNPSGTNVENFGGMAGAQALPQPDYILGTS